MSLSIFTNVSSLSAQRLFDQNTSRFGDSIERVASGFRVNKGSDDIAGLAISEALRSDIRAMRQAIRNTNDGISLLSVAEGALAEQQGILTRLRELASQATTGTIGATERRTLQLEFTALRTELDRIAQTTEFNGRALLDGSLSRTTRSLDHVNLQLGINSSEDSRINLNTELDLDETTSKGLGITDLTVNTAQDALNALDAVRDASDTLTKSRGKLGAIRNRLTQTLANLNISVENLSAADSTIRDADIAEEIAILTRNQILTQASVAMVSHTNFFSRNLIQFL
ncbi:MAG: flagellin [Nitrospinota bacterium]|nr:flagellin [Nitrospinota bacterium]